MRLNTLFSTLIITIVGPIQLYGQSTVTISFQDIPDTSKITRVSFLELYNNFEKYNKKTVEFSGSINCYFEHHNVHPPSNLGNYSKMIWYKLPQKFKTEDFILLAKYTGYDVKIIAIVAGLPENTRMEEGIGYLILQQVTVQN